jgi:xylitol oxidase
MKRKTFLKTSAVFATGALLSPMSACQPKSKAVRQNWAGNYQYQAENLFQPKSADELQDLVKKLGQQKALGSKHCFNDIADSPLNQISTEFLNKVIAIDEQAKTVTVEAGVRYGQFAPELHQKGYALHNLASLPHISVAGACSTATHGSGVKNGNLATAVSAIELVKPNGEILNLSRTKDAAQFNASVVGLGALGIITKVTLDIQKSYEVRQDLFQDLPLQSLKDHFRSQLSSKHS